MQRPQKTKERLRDAEVPMGITARVISVMGAVAFLAPLIMLPIANLPYNDWVRFSHIAIVLICASCWWGLRRGALSPVAALYINGVAVALSNSLLLAVTGQATQTIPTFVLMLLSMIIPVPLGVMLAINVISIASLVGAMLHFGWFVNTGLLMLTTVATLVLIVATHLVRTRREAFYRGLRNEALDAAEQIRASTAREKALLEQIAQDEKLRSLGSLAGGVVHDLNNLLVPVVGNADLLLHESSLGEPQRARVREILRAADRAGQLTRQLSAFAGGAVVALEMLDAAAEVDDIQELVWRGLDDRIHLDWQRPAQPVWVYADRSQLHQIVANLLNNAAEALAGTTLPAITLKLQALDGRAVITVQDNGPGIDDAVVRRVFEPFVSTKGKGRGMGLAAVQGAVKRLGGEIELRSSAAGTEVEVTFPLAEAPPEALSSTAPETPDDQPLSILLVEDEEHVRNTLARMIRSVSSNVFTAESGEQAVEMIGSGLRPSVIITDLRMPGMGGMQAIREIDQIVPRQPVVVCSGYATGSMKALSEREDLVVLNKPVGGSELREAIRSVAAG